MSSGSGSGSGNFLKDFTTLQDGAIFHSLADISAKTDWIFVKIYDRCICTQVRTD